MASTVTERPAALMPLPASAGNVSFAGALRSEFTKLRSVRSTYWTLLTLVIVVVGVGAAIGAGVSHSVQNGHPAPSGGTPGLFGLLVGQLIIAVLGALTVTSEFGTGMIRTSLSVLPRRGMLIAAKGIVFAVVTFVVGLISCFGAFFLCQAFLTGQHINLTLSDPGVLRAVIGGALFLTVCGLLAFGLGLLIRHTAGAITAAVGLLFVLFVLFSIVANFLPQTWVNDANRWIPLQAGMQVWWQVRPQVGNPPVFAPWTGFAVFSIYAAIAIAGGMILFRKRNA